MSRKIFKIMKISAKIKNLRESLNLNREDFALKIGVNPKTISFWENDVNQPTKSKLLTICNICNLPEDYFEEDVIKKVTTNDTEELVEALYYPDVFGSCGNGTFELSQTCNKIQIPRNDFFKDINPLKKYSVINSYGLSMFPTFNDLDKLIVEHCSGNEQIQDNRIYVFCYNDKIFVKRLIYNVDEVIVKSDNPDKETYKTKFIQGDEINKLQLIGQVVGLARNLR